MPAQTDFYITIDRAAGLALDATCSARTARTLPLPQAHRRLINSAVRKLEGAQDDLFKARNDPWSQPTPKHRQLSFL